MSTAMLMDFLVDKENKKINVERVFNGPIDLVWSAWTEADILDQWWAPKPWKAETRSMNFSEGGQWLYAMVSPQGDKHWCRVDFKSIVPPKSYSAVSAFCDENGTLNEAMPMSYWKNLFIENPGTTTVKIEISFDQLADLETLVQMGFREGFAMGMGNLDQYLQTRSKTR